MTQLVPIAHECAGRSSRALRTDAENSISDSELIAKLVRGDEEALGELFDEWNDILFLLTLRIVRDSHTAERIVEEVFWEAWLNTESYWAHRTAATWLADIAMRKALAACTGVEHDRVVGHASRYHLFHQRDAGGAPILAS